MAQVGQMRKRAEWGGHRPHLPQTSRRGRDSNPGAAGGRVRPRFPDLSRRHRTAVLSRSGLRSGAVWPVLSLRVRRPTRPPVGPQAVMQRRLGRTRALLRAPRRGNNLQQVWPRRLKRRTRERALLPSYPSTPRWAQRSCSTICGMMDIEVPSERVITTHPQITPSVSAWYFQSSFAGTPSHPCPSGSHLP